MKHLHIAQQLAIGFGLLLLSLIGVSAFSVYQQDKLGALMVAEFKHPFAVTNAIARVDANVARMARAMRDVVMAESHADIQKFTAEVQTLETKVLDDMVLVKERFLSDKGQSEALVGKIRSWQPIREQVIQFQKTGQTPEAVQVLRTQSVPKVAAINDAIAEIYGIAWQKAEDFQANALEVQQTGRNISIGVSVVFVVLGVLTGFFITRSLTVPIQQAVEVARTVAAGDLSHRFEVRGKNETAQLLQVLQEMQSSLGGVVLAVRTGSESVASASGQIASGNHDLNRRTEEQATMLQQTAASMEQLSSQVQQNADSAKQANQLAQGASSVAIRGGEVVEQVVDTMRGINDASKRIADIIQVIDGIAFQTNILALNAAVEAARAGEQGRGFAVVASEVRNLAGRSADAAKEIKGLIHASVERVEQGAALVDQAGATMNEVVSAIRRVTDMVGEITAASHEQSTAVQQVGTAVMRMDQVTQQNAALVEEMAAAAGGLQKQAQDLVETVVVFKLEGPQSGGYQRPAAAVRAASAVAAPSRSVAPAPTRRALASPANTPPAIHRVAAAGTKKDWELF
ncbi:MAG: MCP four helix bundle domain-containing protein [Burkholderiaceae bacterium]|nr:MCP four helix bundle domain-containing protein [Burkholderiaceae bacterium]